MALVTIKYSDINLQDDINITVLAVAKCWSGVVPDRAPLKEVLGGQYNYREGGRQVEVDDVVRIRAPKKWVAGARIQAQSTGGRYMDRALIST